IWKSTMVRTRIIFARISVIFRLHFTRFISFNIAPLANPFFTKCWQSFRNVNCIILVCVRSACVIDTERWVFFLTKCPCRWLNSISRIGTLMSGLDPSTYTFLLPEKLDIIEMFFSFNEDVGIKKLLPHCKFFSIQKIHVNIDACLIEMNYMFESFLKGTRTRHNSGG